MQVVAEIIDIFSAKSKAIVIVPQPVCHSGDTLVIGAYNEGSSATGVNGNQSNDNAARSGAIYVFTRSGTTWNQQAYLKASNTGANDFFGSWSQQAYIKASDTGANDLFGRSVGVSGNTAVIGAEADPATPPE